MIESHDGLLFFPANLGLPSGSRNGERRATPAQEFKRLSDECARCPLFPPSARSSPKHHSSGWPSPFRFRPSPEESRSEGFDSSSSPHRPFYPSSLLSWSPSYPQSLTGAARHRFRFPSP